jgi:hypothetical protein
MKVEVGAGAPAAVFVYMLSSLSTATDSMKFVEYDQRAHRLETLANFAFWVQSMSSLCCTDTED